MQNCLQTKVIKLRHFRLVVLLAVAVLALGIRFLPIGKADQNPVLYSNSAKYLSLVVPPLAKQNKADDVKSRTPNSEMNNEINENSKNISNQTPSDNAVTEYKFFDGAISQTITVYDADKNITVEMPVEDYVIGCVLAEMPSSFGSQALMAQAVAARTFAVRRMLYPSDEDKKHDAFVCTDFHHCQSFVSVEAYIVGGGNAEEREKKVAQAVEATRGVIAVFNSQPINAVYHAASGYSTLSSQDVWGGKTDYLLPVAAAEKPDVCAKDYGFSYADLSKKLTTYDGKYVPCTSQKNVAYGETDENGCVKNLAVSGKTFTNKELKTALGLRSDDFSAKVSDDGITFTTYGYGHRVGMSQYGADALSMRGYSYLDILKYYYTGIEFAFIY